MDNQTSNAKQGGKEEAEHKERKIKKTAMDDLMYILAGLVTICGIIAALISVLPGNIPNRWPIVLWTSYLGIVFAIGIIAANIQKRISATEQITLDDVYRRQQESIENAEKARRADNRAYIGMDRPVLDNPVLSGKALHVSILAVNTGKTPAKNVRTRIYAEFGPLDKVSQGDRDFPRIGLPDSGVLPSGTGTSMEVGPMKLTPNQLAVAAQPNMGLYVWGYVIYDDVYGDEHRTSFAYVNASPRDTNFWQCNTGNDTN